MESVWSAEDRGEKWTLKPKEGDSEDGTTKKAVNTVQVLNEEQELRKRVIQVINNVEEASERVANYTPNRSDFFHMLSEVSRDKVNSIKEAKKIFEQKLRKVSKACNYEVSSQEALCILAAQNIFSVQAGQVKDNINKDLDLLQH